MTAASLRRFLLLDLDRQVGNFRPGDVVMVREHVELCEVLEIHDPSGQDSGQLAGVCVPSVLACRMDGAGGVFVVEPRDLRLVDRPAGR